MPIDRIPQARRVARTVRWTVGMIMAVLLGACSATQPQSYRDGWRLAGGGHVGYARIDADGGADPQGVAGGARIELFRTEVPWEFGGRLSLGETHVDSSEVGFSIDADVTELVLDGVFRAMFYNERGGFTPWAEAFVGMGYYDADVDVSGAGFGPPGGSDDAFGLSLGGGAGIEFVFDELTSLSVGGELRYALYDTTCSAMRTSSTCSARS